MAERPIMPEMQPVCALMPHSKISDTFTGVDEKTGIGYAIHRATDQAGRECLGWQGAQHEALAPCQPKRCRCPSPS